MPRGWRYTSTETVNRMQTSKEKRLSSPGKILLAPTSRSRSFHLYALANEAGSFEGLVWKQQFWWTRDRQETQFTVSHQLALQKAWQSWVQDRVSRRRHFGNAENRPWCHYNVIDDLIEFATHLLSTSRACLWSHRIRWFQLRVFFRICFWQFVFAGNSVTSVFWTSFSVFWSWKPVLLSLLAYHPGQVLHPLQIPMPSPQAMQRSM